MDIHKAEYGMATKCPAACADHGKRAPIPTTKKMARTDQQHKAAMEQKSADGKARQEDHKAKLKEREASDKKAEAKPSDDLAKKVDDLAKNVAAVEKGRQGTSQAHADFGARTASPRIPFETIVG